MFVPGCLPDPMLTCSWWLNPNEHETVSVWTWLGQVRGTWLAWVWAYPLGSRSWAWHIMWREVCSPFFWGRWNKWPVPGGVSEGVGLLKPHCSPQRWPCFCLPASLFPFPAFLAAFLCVRDSPGYHLKPVPPLLLQPHIWWSVLGNLGLHRPYKALLCQDLSWTHLY